MGIVKSDAQKILEAVVMSNNGHHRTAATIYQKMGNEERNPDEKTVLWKLAQSSRQRGEA